MISDMSPSTTSARKPIQLSSIISVVKQDFPNGGNKMELRSVVRVANNGTNKSKAQESQNPSKISKVSYTAEKPILLLPFGHQVSGRASILCYDETTLLKPYVSRELFFYQNIPQDLKRFTPQFRGLITVSFIEDSRSASILAYGLPHTLVKPNARSLMKLFAEEPKPHSKRCVKDFGKTHVIFPSSPVDPADSKSFDLNENEDLFVASADFSHTMSQTTNNDEGDEDDVVSELSQGFDMTVCIQEKKSVLYENELNYPSTGLHNPWNSKVLDDAWLKLKFNDSDHPSSGKKKRFTLLENVVARYRRPCVLDLKIGTRVRQNASPEKIARHVTAINLGARLSGMQIYDRSKQQFTYQNKYYGHNLTVSGFKSNLRHFFSRGTIPVKRSSAESIVDVTETSPPSIDKKLVRQAVQKLSELRDIVGSIQSHRFYSSSVLLLYEGDVKDSETTKEDCDITVDEDDITITPSLSMIDSQRQMNSRSFSFSEFLQRLKHTQQRRRAKFNQNSPEAHECRAREKTYKNSGRHEKRSTHDKHDVKFGLHENERHLVPRTRAADKCQHQKFMKHHDEYRDPAHDSQFPSKSWPRSKKDQSEPQKIHSRSTKEESSHRIHHELDKPSHREDLKRRHNDSSAEAADDIISVKMIDFAHYCFHDDEMHPGPDGGFLFGLENLVNLLNDMLNLP